MFAALGLLHDEEAVEQLYPLILVEEALLYESVVLSPGEPAGLDRRYTHALDQRYIRGVRISSAPPEAPAGLARLALQLQEHLLVADVGRDRHDLGVAQTHQLGVDHLVADPDIGEQAPVAVALLHVELEPDGLAFDQPAVDLGRLAAPRLLALGRVMDLGGVDADVADLLDAGADPHVDRVTVDDADDGTRHWGGRRQHGHATTHRENTTPSRTTD